MPTDDASGDQKSSRTSIGLSAAGERAMEAIMAKQWFVTNAAAFRAAVAYAIANDLPPSPAGSYKTIWGVATLNKNDFGATVALMLGIDDPWGAVEGLADAGLRAIAERASLADVPGEALLPE